MKFSGQNAHISLNEAVGQSIVGAVQLNKYPTLIDSHLSSLLSGALVILNSY